MNHVPLDNVSRVRFTFSQGTQLTYLLNGSQTAQTWAEQMAQMRWEYLMQSDLNHRHGFATVDEIHFALRRLQSCCAALGFELDAMTNDSWQRALNRVHMGFPALFRGAVETSKFQFAHETNLLIHWLEYELSNAIAGKQAYLFNLDFNHYPPAYNLKRAFPEDEINQFSPVLEFGNLHLHYIYVGRHFLEMFDADDTVCPPSDFRPQHEFNATCGLVFSEPVDPHALDAAMRAFFAKRGGESFFGYAYDSPKLAKGFFVVAQLENLADYATKAQRDALRSQLRAAHVVSLELLDASATVIHSLQTPAGGPTTLSPLPASGLAGATVYSVG